MSRMQSVSLLSDFMRSSCTAQLLLSAAPAQRSSWTAVHILSKPACVVAQGLLRGRAHREITAHHGRGPPRPHPTHPTACAPQSRGELHGVGKGGRGRGGGSTLLACPLCQLSVHHSSCSTRRFLGNSLVASILSQCVRCSLCRCVRMPRCCDFCRLLVLNNMVPGASGLVFAPALRSTDSPSLRARRRHKGVRVSRAPVPPQHRPSPVSLCGRASYRAHFEPLYGQAWRCKGATPKSLH